MKKLLFSTVAFVAMTLAAGAQQRMALNEEFTGENCPPCATYNPAFWALCNSSTPAPGNPTKLIHISYMVPIPSSGWYYMRTQALSDARASYYSVSSAPSCRFDGNAAGTGHPADFTQSHIDNEYAVASPFNMTVSNTYNATYDTVITTITVTCVTAYTPALSLRTALVQTNNFATAPGTNGEVNFENVVQAMYPNAAGTAIPASSWVVGVPQTFTIRGAVPSFVDKNASAPSMVVWLQNDATKDVVQAAKGAALPMVPLDVASTATAGPTGLICATGTYTVAHSVTIKNTGTTPLTSATIFYQVDGGTWSSYPWSGTLAVGATATATMPAINVTIGASDAHVIIDSVGKPNGSTDYNLANNKSGFAFFIQNTNGMALPYTTSFEGDSTWYFVNSSSRVGVFQGGTGHTGTHMAGFEIGFLSAGSSATLVLPNLNISTPASTVVDYWVAYAQCAATNTDQLEVVYSTDCGANWTSLSSATPTPTLTMDASYLQTPSAASQYKKYTQSLNAVPAGTDMIGFRATRNGGNSMWIDDINVRSAVSVNDIANATADVNLYPNPTNATANLSFSLAGASDVNVQVVDNLGRVVSVVTNSRMEAGMHTMAISTATLAAGIYNVMIHTDAGTVTERLSVIK